MKCVLFLVFLFHMYLICQSFALSFRVMLYNVYEGLTKENLEKLKYLLNPNLSRRQLETSTVRKHLHTGNDDITSSPFCF